MEWYHVYLFTRLDNINCALNIIFGICVIICLSSGFLYLLEESEIYKGIIIKVGGFGLVIILVGIFIPSQKEAAAIYLLPKLAKSDFVKEAEAIPSEATKLLRLKLEAWVADLEPKKETK